MSEAGSDPEMPSEDRSGAEARSDPEMPSEAEVRRALRRWVESRAVGLQPGTLDDETPLIASRLITSLQVTDLLLLIEELRAQSIDPSSLRPGAFHDIDTIWATFFAGRSGGSEVG